MSIEFLLQILGDNYELLFLWILLLHRRNYWIIYQEAWNLVREFQLKTSGLSEYLKKYQISVLLPHLPV